MSNGNGPNQVKIVVIEAAQKALAHDLEVTVQHHLNRGEVSMVVAAGMLRHVAALLDLRVMQHVRGAQQEEGPQIMRAPAGLDQQIKPQGE